MQLCDLVATAMTLLMIDVGESMKIASPRKDLDQLDSASFFTRASTGRPVFLLAVTAACAAALRTARLRVTGFFFGVAVVMFPLRYQ